MNEIFLMTSWLGCYNSTSTNGRVVTASVREDRGKFVDSTWEIVIDGVRYWVTIGMGTFIKTIVIKETSGVENCIRSGGYYDFVEKVNRKLIDEDLEINAIP